ncbi:MAG TPA: class I adenylate-forming enzyme family protein [Xanthobacteraceae bacterium]|jgi:acyl-CoA synthetase (AMP-forming)/AMP-acid ligase II|nr:class I adenylate-forming enzyme family protein [Xanthobacteraceae bacterium]
MLHTDLIAPIPELLRRHAAVRGGKCAFRDATTSVTYGELESRTARLAGHLAENGVLPNDTVAIMLPNSVPWVESCLAITRAGAIGVPISYDATESEIAYRIADAECTAVITTAERGDLIALLQARSPKLKTLIVTNRGICGAVTLSYARLLAETPASPPRDPALLHETAFILYTSGTTGRAKGVRLTVHGMLWVAAACWAPITGLSERDTVLSPLPLFHSYALNLSVLSILATGATEYIMERFSTSEAVRLLKTGEFTYFPGVPTMFHYLLQATRSEKDVTFPNLRLCASAGAIMPATLNREFESHLKVPLLDGYGITETSTMVTMNWPTGSRVMGSCGVPVPGSAVRIVDLHGNDVATGKEGELIVHGPHVMPGYHNKPEETKNALRNGWYYTGDLAKSDENGFLTITGRLKELIIRGGQNIAPAEIEEVVNTFAAVLDCAVVGVPHEHLGEVPALFIVPRPGHTLESEAVLAHCRVHLSAYKVPHIVRTIAEIPRTGSGKIIRYKLRENLQA